MELRSPMAEHQESHSWRVQGDLSFPPMRASPQWGLSPLTAAIGKGGHRWRVWMDKTADIKIEAVEACTCRSVAARLQLRATPSCDCSEIKCACGGGGRRCGSIKLPVAVEKCEDKRAVCPHALGVVGAAALPWQLAS
jgi:hypothetical protein